MRLKLKKVFSFDDSRKVIKAVGGPNIARDDVFLRWMTRELLLFRAEAFRLQAELEAIEKDFMRQQRLTRKKLEASYKRMRDA